MSSIMLGVFIYIEFLSLNNMADLVNCIFRAKIIFSLLLQICANTTESMK